MMTMVATTPGCMELPMITSMSGYFVVPICRDCDGFSTVSGPFESVAAALAAVEDMSNHMAPPTVHIIHGMVVLAETVHIVDGVHSDAEHDAAVAVHEHGIPGWDSIEGGKEEPATFSPDEVQKPKDSRWDARSSFMTNVISNVRSMAREIIGEVHTTFTDQTLLDIYGDAYLSDDPENTFAAEITHRAARFSDNGHSVNG